MEGRWTRRSGVLLVAWCLWTAAAAADELPDFQQWQRIDSRYCTIWVDRQLDVGQVNRKVSIWGIRPQTSIAAFTSPNEQLAAKCDTLFRRVEELLGMYPPGVHVTIAIARRHEQIRATHAARYGFGTDAVAFYVFEINAIYAAARELSSSVLAHEMAHCVIDQYFGIRSPRQVEEILPMYVDAHLQD